MVRWYTWKEVVKSLTWVIYDEIETLKKGSMSKVTMLKSTPALINLLTDTAAILNLLDLRSIMVCRGSTRSVFTREFWAKKERNWIFLGKNTIIITFKQGTTIFFSDYNLLLGKLKEKLARKARVNAERVYRIVLMPPGHPVILLNLINSIWLPYR